MKTTTVRDWMIDLVVYVEPDATVTEALALMRRRYIHSVLVNKTDKSPEYGILTSTDICDKIVAQDRNPSQTLVREVMNSPLTVVTENMNLQECAVIMREKKIHHLPVVNAGGTIVGMISATDFLVVAEALGSAPGERIV